MDLPSVRIDKWLWAVRLFRTRTLAAEACKAGHVEIAGHAVKPSRSVRTGEVISARIGIITRTVRVLGLIEKRVGASIVTQHAEDMTPASEYEKLKERREAPAFYQPGFGRPTKKHRRAVDRLLSGGAGSLETV